MYKYIRIVVLMGIGILLTGCHSAEKAEAVKLVKSLQENSTTLTALNSQEAQIINGLSSSIGQHTFLDIGNNHNSAGSESSNYSNQLKAITTALSGMNVRLVDLKLMKPATQTIRDGAISILNRRFTFLNGVINQLDDSARTFPTIEGQPFSFFANDAKWPTSYLQLKNQLASYHPPTDSFDSFVMDLRTKYELTTSDLN